MCFRVTALIVQGLIQTAISLFLFFLMFSSLREELFHSC